VADRVEKGLKKRGGGKKRERCENENKERKKKGRMKMLKKSEIFISCSVQGPILFG
jgi:hypothetical protein